MKKTILATSLALLALAAPGRPELSLTPRLVTLDFAGHSVRRAFFMDGTKKFAVTLDSETEMNPQAGGVLFCFTRLPLATVELRRSPVQAGVPFSQENISSYAKAARQLLAPSAEIWPEEPMVMDPLPINGWKTCRFNFFYRVGGSPIRTDVTFIELSERDQIVLITGASADHYAAVRSRSDDIIRRWHEVTPEDERGVN
jgi:hypothetical protein